MNSPTLGLRVASVLFGVMMLAQLLRLVMQPDVLVAGHAMPLWPSVLAGSSWALCASGCGNWVAKPFVRVAAG